MKDEFVWLVSFCSDKELIGRKFRAPDVEYGTWPEGTIFTNVRTGQVRVWQGARSNVVHQPQVNTQTRLFRGVE